MYHVEVNCPTQRFHWNSILRLGGGQVPFAFGHWNIGRHWSINQNNDDFSGWNHWDLLASATRGQDVPLVNSGLRQKERLCNQTFWEDTEKNYIFRKKCCWTAGISKFCIVLFLENFIHLSYKKKVICVSWQFRDIPTRKEAQVLVWDDTQIYVNTPPLSKKDQYS